MGNCFSNNKNKNNGCALDKVKGPSAGEIVEVKGGELRKILDAHLQGGRVQYTTIMKDETYSLFSLESLKRFLQANRIDVIKYKKEVFDCDDFADVLMGSLKNWIIVKSGTYLRGGIPFGTILGDIRHDVNSKKYNPHAMNIFVDNRKRVHFIEPQNDRIYTPTPKNSGYWYVYI